MEIVSKQPNKSAKTMNGLTFICSMCSAKVNQIRIVLVGQYACTLASQISAASTNLISSVRQLVYWH